MEETHGNLDSTRPTSLEQVWGEVSTDIYTTNSLDKYLEKINEMNLPELQGHATRVGIVPIASRERLLKALERQFQLHWAKYERVSVIKNKKLSSAAKKILAEGA